MTEQPKRSGAKPSRRRRPSVFRQTVEMILLVLVAVGIVAFFVQVGFAGYGAFGGSFELHESLGYVIAAYTLLIFIIALIAWPGPKIVLLALLLLLLGIAGQIGLAELGKMGSDWFGALHAVDGTLVLVVMIWLLASIIRRRRARKSG